MLLWVKHGFGFLLRFFFRSFKAAMRCFFRTRDDRHFPTPQLISSPPRSTEVLISGNRLSSLLSKERESSARDDDVGSQHYAQELKDEVKFLKACGAIAGTPVEIRKASEKLKASPACDNDSDHSKFHSWLPSASVEKLPLDVQFEQPTPIKLDQEWGNRKDSFDFEHTPSSYIFKARDTRHDSPDYVEGSWTRSPRTACKSRKNEASVTPWPASDTQKKSKSVRFKCGRDLLSYRSPSDDWHMKASKSPNNQSACKQSPYPTPLKLFEEMQTPGTVYPASSDHELPNGKPRVRSQFIYPICNPGLNELSCKILAEKGFKIEQAQNAAPTSEEELKKIANENESNLEASLSSWLEPASTIVEETNETMEASDSQIPLSACGPINGKIHAQWIYNPSHFELPCKILEDKGFNPEQDSSKLNDSVEQAKNAATTPVKELKEITNENESNMEASLSSWLEPAPIIVKERKEIMEAADSQISHFAKAYRQILGEIPTQWNGIPNSTKKYKEDQKVKWHATPFEERLAKALSEENFISQRKLVIEKSMAFEEIEESDTEIELPQQQ